MSKKIFSKGTQISDFSSATIGWQNKENALWGIKEGYKNAADSLVDIALEKGNHGDTKTLDTYIFPILFLYRHSLEVSLKLIYQRNFGTMMKGHKLDVLWGKVYEEIIKDINDEKFLEKVRGYKENFIQWSINDIDFEEISNLFDELQKIDKQSDTWRYLVDNNGNLFFNKNEYIDYENLRKVVGNIYEQLDYFYTIVSEYLSG